jgi:hypothetical protein
LRFEARVSRTRPLVIVTAVPYLLARAARLSDLVWHDEFLEAEPPLGKPE